MQVSKIFRGTTWTPSCEDWYSALGPRVATPNEKFLDYLAFLPNVALLCRRYCAYLTFSVATFQSTALIAEHFQLATKAMCCIIPQFPQCFDWMHHRGCIDTTP